jgi:hypothetical protein
LVTPHRSKDRTGKLLLQPPSDLPGRGIHGLELVVRIQVLAEVADEPEGKVHFVGRPDIEIGHETDHFLVRPFPSLDSPPRYDRQDRKVRRLSDRIKRITIPLSR